MKKCSAIVLIMLILMGSCSVTAEQTFKIGDVISFGKYEQDGNKNNGAEPIQWKVLTIEDNKALLITVNGLEAISYSEAMDITAYNDDSLSWETSYLRLWMNKDFFNKAFTDEEKKQIAKTKIENKDDFGRYTTNDAVFSLSISEADKYFVNAVSMACSATAAAKKQLNVDQGAISKEGYCNWWLRDMTSVATPQSGYNFMSAKGNEAGWVCGNRGTTSSKSGTGLPVFVDYLCTARPAIWIECASSKDSNLSAEENTTVYLTLEIGAKGDEVIALQSRLNALGYNLGSADGNFGNETKEAIELFQKQHNLKITGIADITTQELLFSEKAEEAPVVHELNNSGFVIKKGLAITSAILVMLAMTSLTIPT